MKQYDFSSCRLSLEIRLPLPRNCINNVNKLFVLQKPADISPNFVGNELNETILSKTKNYTNMFCCWLVH